MKSLENGKTKMTRETREEWNILFNNLFTDQQQLYWALKRRKISVDELLKITDSIVYQNGQMKNLIRKMKDTGELMK